MGPISWTVKAVLATLLSAAGAGTLDPPGEAVRAATVSLSGQVILFTQDGTEANLARVSTGRPGFGTPTGEFTVLYRRWAPVSSRYHVRMPYWLCLTSSGEIGLHQASGARALRRLGEPLSHGCVRLGSTTAPWAYRWLPDGAGVSIRP
jgi:lipoprotein-anchoring transpeptidase ErfK/SrfK